MLTPKDENDDVILGGIAEGFHLALRCLLRSAHTRDMIDGTIHVIFVIEVRYGAVWLLMLPHAGMASFTPPRTAR